MSLPVPTEKRCQEAVRRLFLAAGCQVCSLSQPRRTLQSAGLPDLWVFCPRRRMAWWWEVKRPGGRLRPEQQAFRDRCLETGVRYHWGGLPEAITMLADLDLVG
ncbi:MAG: VRR-NUC domain-containing protein [Gemmatimonadales bacterium]